MAEVGQLWEQNYISQVWELKATSFPIWEAASRSTSEKRGSCQKLLWLGKWILLYSNDFALYSVARTSSSANSAQSRSCMLATSPNHHATPSTPKNTNPRIQKLEFPTMASRISLTAGGGIALCSFNWRLVLSQWCASVNFLCESTGSFQLVWICSYFIDLKRETPLNTSEIAWHRLPMVTLHYRACKRSYGLSYMVSHHLSLCIHMATWVTASRYTVGPGTCQQDKICIIYHNIVYRYIHVLPATYEWLQATKIYWHMFTEWLWMTNLIDLNLKELIWFWWLTYWFMRLCID